VKRLIDIVVSAVLLLILAPTFVVVALAVVLESRGAVFYRAARVGLSGRDLHVIKFRKMTSDAKGGPLTTSVDLRFTRIGAFLTATKLDELPQLWNVLRGHMSLVGPRPEDRQFVELHFADYQEIITARPGLTGLSQLAFASENTILDQNDPLGHYVARILPQKASMDRLYVRERTVWLDLRILLWTVLPVLFRIDVAVNRATGALTVRRRPAASEPATIAPSDAQLAGER
jgi:lipopolysaccharide/colanic/teichoic acid biosynthesis glycosyltransferase